MSLENIFKSPKKGADLIYKPYILLYTSFTFEMDIGKGVLAIDIYNFIHAKQNDIGGALLIYIAGQPRSIIIALVVSMHSIGKILDRCKYIGMFQKRPTEVIVMMKRIILLIAQPLRYVGWWSLNLRLTRPVGLVLSLKLTDLSRSVIVG